VAQTTTQNSEQMAKTTQDFVDTTLQSTFAAWKYAVRAQQINATFAQRFTKAWIDALRQQSELSLEMTQEFSDKGEDQADAFRRFFDWWGFSVTGFPFDPFSFWREGMRFTERTARETSANNKAR
jgi:hypothetical protein